jgi:hypothetical protein
MKTSKVIGVALASMAATAAFILACDKGPGAARAQSCTAWEVSLVSIQVGASDCEGASVAQYPNGCRLANGWEPFAQNGTSEIIVRRCAQ